MTNILLKVRQKSCSAVFLIKYCNFQLIKKTKRLNNNNNKNGAMKDIKSLKKKQANNSVLVGIQCYT